MTRQRLFLACILSGLWLTARAVSLSVDGLPIHIGDNVQEIQSALHTRMEPEDISTPLPTGTTASEIHLKTKGVWVFFSPSGISQTIRLDAPFAGSIGGIKIGNSRTHIINTIGKPAFDLTNLHTRIDGLTPIQYYLDENTLIRFDFDADDEVMTMYITKATPQTSPAPNKIVALTSIKEGTMAYQSAADQGDPNAQFQLSLLYQNGTGVPRDYVKAFNLLQKAADQGFVSAEINLGAAYLGGHGVTQDFIKALYWYQKAADQGAANAQFSLGVAYCYGNGGPLDYTKAVYWFRKSAEQGFPIAASKLGYAYEHGLGVQQDTVKAQYWYKRGATPGQLGPGME